MNTTVPQVSSTLTWRDTLARWALRWDIGRGRASVPPGLFRIGEPTSDSPVFATANYRMTFDLVRRDLGGLDAWLLVLDTRGVNVWCAAGKGTFSTKELVTRAISTGLAGHISHSTIVVPQLAATGVSAYEARKTGGFKVVFGPVRSRDIGEFMAAGMKATPEMRAVEFPLKDRAALAPVETIGAFKRWKALVPIALLGAGWLLSRGSLFAAVQPAAAYTAGVIGGGLLTPILLPWIPGRAFSLKGALAGGLAGAAASIALGASALAVIAGTLLAAAIGSFVGVNFTGATPYTSPSGVEKELRRALPLQAAAAVVSGVIWVLQFVLG